jgi:hypothetical protein
MKTFTDAAGRTWTMALNLGTALAVKSKLDIDLLQPEAGNPPLITRLGTDELLLGEVLCALLENQFVANKVTETDVCLAFDGKTLLNAQKAFYEELEDFFRSRGRVDRAQVVAAQGRFIQKATAAVEQKLAAIDIDAMIDGALSGSLPES